MIKKVSILIPLYNSEEYISETIESCLAQTYPNIEIIIVDDGSTDRGFVIAQEYQRKYNNIILEKQKNSGASKARNRAFELSTGDYIQYLDADDLLDNQKISMQVTLLERKEDKSVTFSKWGFFKKEISSVEWKNLPVNKDYHNPKQFLTELWASGMATVIHVWLVPRILIEESEGWNEQLAVNQDGDFFARIVITSSNIYFTDRSLCYYRRDNSQSVSKQVTTRALKSRLLSFETYLKLMQDDLEDSKVRRSLALVYSRYIYNTDLSNLELINEAQKKIESLGFKEPIIPFPIYEEWLCYLFGVYRTIKIKQVAKRFIRR
jgi:glycosyltransferase involved in cell wall biosynthesis